MTRRTLLVFMLIFGAGPYPLSKWNRFRETIAADNARWAKPWFRAKELVRPGTASEVMPPKVSAALRLLERHRIDRYSISALAKTDALLMQRIAEGGYPAVMTRGATFRLLFAEPLPAGCRAVEVESEVSLADCR